MRLNRLSVKNFRGFEQQDFLLHPRFNLVIGENASGKTSVLEAAAVAIGSLLLGFPNAQSRHIRNGDVRTVIQDVNGRIRDLHIFPVVVSASGEFVDSSIRYSKNQISLEWSRTLSRRGGRTTQVDASSVKKLAAKMAKNVLSGGHPTLPLIRYFGAGRLWESVRSSKPSSGNSIEFDDLEQEGGEINSDIRSPFYGYHLSVDKRCSPKGIIDWIARERHIELDEESTSRSLQFVYKSIRELMPEFESVRYSFRHETLLFLFNNKDYLTFGSLSDGYRNVIAMVADIAIKMVMLNPHLHESELASTPGVVLIDELDLHLHPIWQRRIVADLQRAFPNIQYICTTHLPFIVQSLNSGDELIVLNGQPTADVANMTIEEVAEGLMRVENSEVSVRYGEMKGTARQFLEHLEEREELSDQDLIDFHERLARDVAPYADNPAYQAFLEMKLESKARKQ